MVEVKETKGLIFKIPSDDLDKIEYVYDLFHSIKDQIDANYLGDFLIRNVKTGDEISRQNLIGLLNALIVLGNEDVYVVE